MATPTGAGSPIAGTPSILSVKQAPVGEVNSPVPARGQGFAAALKDKVRQLRNAELKEKLHEVDVLHAELEDELYKQQLHEARMASLETQKQVLQGKIRELEEEYEQGRHGGSHH